MFDDAFTEDLELARSRLRHAWAELRQYWRDAVAARFDREYVDPIEERLHALIAALGELSEVANECQRLVDYPED